jgi:hypothetical protein
MAIGTVYLRRIIGLLIVFAGTAALSQVETPVEADQFVESIGVNVHLGYTNTLYYNNFPLIESALATLQVRHVRDSAPIAAPPGFYANHSALAAYKIHGLFSAAITDLPSQIASYPGLFTFGYFEAFEPPDECDVSSLCGQPWASNLIAFLPTLQSNAGSYPVLGPSFASPLGAPQVGNVAEYTGYGNLHNYKGGWNPGFAGSWGYDYVNYLSDALAIQLAGITNPGQPVMSTETGYTNAIATETTQLGYPAGTLEPYDANSISEANAATYMPRVPLMAWLNGIQRTYIYELLSSPGEDYGLLRGDGSQKPAFLALENLIGTLMDTGYSFTPTPLAYTITGGDSTMRHLLLQKRNSKYYLVIWLESSIYNKFTNTPTPVAPETIVVQTGTPMCSPEYLTFDSTGATTKHGLPAGGAPWTMSVSPNILILFFTPATSAGCS